MSNEEAIKWIERFELAFPLPIEDYIDAKEALDMAIKALEQTELNSSYNSVKPELDCISREAVEKITWEEPSYTDALNILTEVREKVRALPSVTPKAEWIPCSERLPEKVAFYLTSIEWGDDTKGVTISWFDGMSFKAEVKAWMPLPSSYQVESEE